MDLLDAALDLLLGESCVGCGCPGRLLCQVCLGGLPATPFRAWPEPLPPGLREPWAAAAYDGTVRELVLGLKEHRLLALTTPLAGLLAGAVTAALTALATRQRHEWVGPMPMPMPGSVVMVPVPSRPATVRARGHDPTQAVTLAAARMLRRRGVPVTVARVLRVRRGVSDQAGLDAVAREANLAGSMHCPAYAVARVQRRRPCILVVCDDVLTTGSTAREALRALWAVGLPAQAVSAVAATAKRAASTPVQSTAASQRIVFPTTTATSNVASWSPPAVNRSGNSPAARPRRGVAD